MLDAEVVGGTSGEFSLGFDEGSLGDTRVYVLGLGHTWTLSPSLVLDGNLGLNRQDQTVTGPDYGENIGLEILGIPGTNGINERAGGLHAFDMATATHWASADVQICRTAPVFVTTTHFDVPGAVVSARVYAITGDDRENDSRRCAFSARRSEVQTAQRTVRTTT